MFAPPSNQELWSVILLFRHEQWKVSLEASLIDCLIVVLKSSFAAGCEAPLSIHEFSRKRGELSHQLERRQLPKGRTYHLAVPGALHDFVSPRVSSVSAPITIPVAHRNAAM